MRFIIDKVLIVIVMTAGFLSQTVMAAEQETSDKAEAEQSVEAESDAGENNKKTDKKLADEDNEEPECD